MSILQSNFKDIAQKAINEKKFKIKIKDLCWSDKRRELLLSGDQIVESIVNTSQISNFPAIHARLKFNKKQKQNEKEEDYLLIREDPKYSPLNNKEFKKELEIYI